MRLFAMTCGWLTAATGMFLEGVEGTLRVPVPAFLIEHPDGLVLFDSGLHVDVAADPVARLGLASSFFTADFAPDQGVAARLSVLGVDAARVRYLINSHLHFDHSGGNAAIPNAQLVVQRAEWTAGHSAEQIRRNAYDPRDYDLGHDVLAMDGEHDLFGDGRVVCIPTPGHTPGHQSLRVELASGPVVLAADACYLRRTLDELHLPPIVSDPDAMRASLHRLRALQVAGARIFYGHDPEFWATLPPAPLPIE